VDAAADGDFQKRVTVGTACRIARRAGELHSNDRKSMDLEYCRAVKCPYRKNPVSVPSRPVGVAQPVLAISEFTDALRKHLRAELPRDFEVKEIGSMRYCFATHQSPMNESPKDNGR
jgi:hypothetical protein